MAWNGYINSRPNPWIPGNPGISEFHFTIAKNDHQMTSMVGQCLHKKQELLVKYQDLQTKLSGDINLSESGAIATTIEQYLCDYRNR